MWYLFIFLPYLELIQKLKLKQFKNSKKCFNGSSKQY